MSAPIVLMRECLTRRCVARCGDWSAWTETGPREPSDVARQLATERDARARARFDAVNRMVDRGVAFADAIAAYDRDGAP